MWILFQDSASWTCWLRSLLGSACTKRHNRWCKSTASGGIQILFVEQTSSVFLNFSQINSIRFSCSYIYFRWASWMFTIVGHTVTEASTASCRTTVRTVLFSLVATQRDKRIPNTLSYLYIDKNIAQRCNLTVLYRAKLLATHLDWRCTSSSCDWYIAEIFCLGSIWVHVATQESLLASVYGHTYIFSHV